MVPLLGLRYGTWLWSVEKPWASRTPAFTTLGRTPSPHVHCIVEKTVGPDDVRVETTWQDDQGGVGVGTSPGQGPHYIRLYLEPWPRRGNEVTLPSSGSVPSQSPHGKDRGEACS